MADFWSQDPIAPGKATPAAPDIEVEGPGGQIFAFPSGTSQNVMREALVRHYGTPAGRPGPNAAAPSANDWWGKDQVVQPPSASQAPVSLRALPGADEAGGDASAAVGRGIIEGVPIAGPYLLGGVNRAVAGIRSLQNDTKFSDELARTERFGSRTATAHPIASGAGAMVGGTLATLPLVAAAPAAFGAGAGGLLARSGASLVSGAALGGADAAVRSEGDLGSIGGGAALGGALGAVGPGLGHVAGKVVGAVRGGTRGEPVLREALHGFPEADLAAAQALREQSLNLPGGGVPLSFDEALNQVTGGRATRLSQIARVTTNSGGEAGRMTGEFYAARPGQVERTGRASFDLLGPAPVSPSALGIEAQTAARAGIAQTPEGMALTQARNAVGPRLGDDAAGQVIQRDLRATADLREAVRGGQAARDYGAARNAPENAGIERMVSVERPGEPIVTQPTYSRPQFTDDAPRPLEAFTRPTAEAGEAGTESLARFIARNGGLDLTGDLRSQDFHRFNIPGAGTVAREGGNPLDSFWRPKLIEAGYLRPDADGGMQRDIRSELLRKLTNERRGVPSYPIGQERTPVSAGPSRMADDYNASLSLAESRLNEDLARVGVDPASVHPDIRSRTLGALMRGEHGDPLDAYERTVGAMQGPLQPYSRSTTVTEQIPDVRFGQVDPRPALDAIGEQARTAKGDVRGALGNARRDLFEPGGDVDMSIAGLLHARERLDFQIRSAQEVGDATKVRDLTITRNALDGQLKGVPEVATADANFAANSRPLEPFTGNTPLGRIVRQDPLSGRMAMPTEQVPTHLQGASAAREFLTNASPAARQAYEGNLATRLMDSATDARGNVTAEGLMKAIREHGDVLEAAPGVRDRVAGVARARDALAPVEKTPLGKVAATDETGAATRALFPTNPLPNSQGEVGGAMAALARNNPTVARALARTHLEGLFNEATQTVRGVAQQYGGAGFASAVRGNPQQRTNLDAALRALPDGEQTGSVMNRFLTALEATGYRPQRGSDTAFNQAIQKQLGSGKTPVGQAVSDVVSSAALGGAFGGLHGAAGGAFVGLRRGLGDAVTQARMMGNTAAVARMLLDPTMAPNLQTLARRPGGSRGTEDFVQRLLLMIRSSGMQGHEPRPMAR